jgi:hypothetical protein
MKPHGSVRFVRRCCGMHADHVLKCLDDLEGLNNRYFPIGRGPQVLKLINSVRHGAIVPSQDLSGAWVTVYG